MDINDKVTLNSIFDDNDDDDLEVYENEVVGRISEIDHNNDECYVAWENGHEGWYQFKDLFTTFTFDKPAIDIPSFNAVLNGEV